MPLYPLLACLLLQPVSAHGTEEVSEPNDSQIIEKALACLKKAEEWELLSLEPSPNLMERLEKWISETFIPKELRFLAPYPEEADFHDWRILGSTTVKKEATRHGLVAALFEGITAGIERSRRDRR